MSIQPLRKNATTARRLLADTKVCSSVLSATILIAGQSRNIIECVANRDFGFVKSGETVWLVRSSVPAASNRYYVVHALVNGGYECSCSGCQERHGAQCKHIKAVSDQFRPQSEEERILAEKLAAYEARLEKEAIDQEERRKKFMAELNAGIAERKAWIATEKARKAEERKIAKQAKARQDRFEKHDAAWQKMSIPEREEYIRNQSRLSA